MAKGWRQPRYPVTDRWVDMAWHVHTMEYCSALKEKEILTHVATWMKLEDIMLGKAGQTQRWIPYDSLCMRNLK